jgi:hypothetical protein
VDQASQRVTHSYRPRDTIAISERDIDPSQRESDISRGSKAGHINAKKPIELFEEQSEEASLLHQERLSQCHTEGDEAEDENGSQDTSASFTSTLSIHHSLTRCDAYERMLQNYRGIGWNSIELISAGCNHSAVEKEL